MDIEIDKKEVLRYLGHKGQEYNKKIDELIDKSIEEIKKISKPKYTYNIFNIDYAEEELILKECNLYLTGNSIKGHLAGCEKAVVIGATLGINVDNEIRKAEASTMLKAYILDACGTEMIEKICDEVEKEIQLSAKKDRFSATPRFSPGYGDLPIETQIPIGRILDTSRKIGLTITNNSLMIPRKSVTAIIGLGKNINTTKEKNCENCLMNKNCNFRKEGKNCES